MTAEPKATRSLKTPKQRAQEAVDILQRRVDKLRAAADQLAVEEKRLAHAKASPDLAPPPSGTTSVSSVQPAAGGALMNDAP